MGITGRYCIWEFPTSLSASSALKVPIHIRGILMNLTTGYSLEREQSFMMMITTIEAFKKIDQTCWIILVDNNLIC